MTTTIVVFDCTTFTSFSTCCCLHFFFILFQSDSFHTSLIILVFHFYICILYPCRVCVKLFYLFLYQQKFFSIICLLIRIYLLFNFIFLIWFYKHKLVLHKNTPSAVLSGKESIIVTSIFIMSKLFMRNYLCYKKMLEQKIKTLMPTDCSVLRTSAILPII